MGAVFEYENEYRCTRGSVMLQMFLEDITGLEPSRACCDPASRRQLLVIVEKEKNTAYEGLRKLQRGTILHLATARCCGGNSKLNEIKRYAEGV